MYGTPLNVEVLSASPAAKLSKKPFVGALVRSSVYAVRMGLAYMSLSVMSYNLGFFISYNLGFFIAAIAGHAVGFFIVKARALAAAARGEENGSGPKV